MYITRDFCCENCGNKFEEMITREEDKLGTRPCVCGHEAQRALSIPRVGAFSAMSAEDRVSHLKKRSLDHSKAEAKKRSK